MAKALPRFRLVPEDFQSAYQPGVEPRVIFRIDSQRRINQLRARFLAEDKNPIYVWSAWDVARAAGLQTPDWVMAYFSLVYENLRGLEREPPHKKKIAAAIVEAFGFVRGGAMIANLKNTFTVPSDAARFWEGEGKDPILNKNSGRYNPFRNRDRFHLAFTVYKHRADGATELQARAKAVEELGEKKEDRIEHAWKLYRRYFPPCDRGKK